MILLVAEDTKSLKIGHHSSLYHWRVTGDRSQKTEQSGGRSFMMQPTIEF